MVVRFLNDCWQNYELSIANKTANNMLPIHTKYTQLSTWHRVDCGDKHIIRMVSISIGDVYVLVAEDQLADILFDVSFSHHCGTGMSAVMHGVLSHS